MSSAIVFDTHAFVKRLTAVGMPLIQAEVLAEEQAKLIDERLSPKADLRELELRLTVKLGTMVVVAIVVLALGALTALHKVL